MAYASIGDIFCTPGDALLGDRLLDEMKTTFDRLQAQLGDPYAYDFVERFSTSVNTLLTTRANTSRFWGASDCTIKDLGNQAAPITAAMTQWVSEHVGIVQGLPASNTQTQNPVTDLLGKYLGDVKWVAVGALGLVGVWAYYTYGRALRRR